jgi:hypothetical protein
MSIAMRALSRRKRRKETTGMGNIAQFQKGPVNLNPGKKDLKKYKHIYISRKDGEYLVEYSNKLKGFK